MRKFVAFGVVPALLAGTVPGLTLSASAAPKAVKTAAKKPHAQPGTLGTHQMAGGDAQFGRPYTYVAPFPISGPINLTVKSVEYAVGRINFNTGDNHYAPHAGQKLVIIHYGIKNPEKTDISFQNLPLFQTVDAAGATQDVPGRMRRQNGRDEIAFHLKPGQGVDDLISATIIPANAPLDKLIVILGRVGTHDKVTRFPLGTPPNVVQPIPAPYADPADPTGATPLAVVPAKIGTPYTAGFLDLSLDSVAYAPGPFGDRSADAGKQFLVATVTATNRQWQAIGYRDGTQILNAVLKTDDEKTTNYVMLKGKRDEVYGGDSIDPDDSRTIRLLFQIPKDAKAKSLSLAENIDYSGQDYSHALLYDLSGAQ